MENQDRIIESLRKEAEALQGPMTSEQRACLEDCLIRVRDDRYGFDLAICGDGYPRAVERRPGEQDREPRLVFRPDLEGALLYHGE